MKRGGGNQKGGSFERSVCKALSLWVSHDKNTDLFWRSSMSGGRATVARAKGQTVRQSGDVCAVAPEGHPFVDRWYVECKHIRNLALESFLLKDIGLCAKFWKTAVKEARHYRRSAMLIAKQNNTPILVITKTGGLDQYLTPLLVCPGRGFSVYSWDDLLKVTYTTGR